MPVAAQVEARGDPEFTITRPSPVAGAVAAVGCGEFGAVLASLAREGGAIVPLVRGAEAGEGWVAVARADDVGTTPVEVRAGERDWVIYRPAADAPVVAVEARCPHRLVRLAHATPVEGGLQCAYHGWRFDSAGRCLLVPSSGPAAELPPRAQLVVPAGIREQGGTVWLAPGSTGAAAVADERATTRLFTNVDASLEHGWHPLALSSEVPAAQGEWLAARLLGRAYRVGRDTAGDLVVEPAVAALEERFGVVRVAPRAPLVPLIDSADDADPEYAQGWLVPDESRSPAGALAENFLDIAHFPFVHAGTFGAAEEPYVEAYDVVLDGDDGLTVVQEQWFDNPEDPGVIAGERPARQRRRALYSYRWPFQLQLRLEELDAGAVKTILFFLQPQAIDSTRIYTKMLLHGIGGVAVPGPDVVAREVAFEVAVLAEDLALQQAMTVTGLPLGLRDELHVRSDRSGVALRRILAHHVRATENPPLEAES